MISQAIIPAIEASVSCFGSGTCLRLCLAVETDIDLYRCYQSFTGVPPYVAACADAFRLPHPHPLPLPRRRRRRTELHNNDISVGTT